MNDGEIDMTGNKSSNTVVENQSEAVHTQTPAIDAQPMGRKSRLMVGMGVVAVCLVAGTVIYSGIHSRVEAEAVLTRSTDDAAIPSVTVVHPTLGSAAQDIVLPGNTEAFTDTPIYARTSGYLKKWYFDIGAHVQKGQLLAEIETPELDQQLNQAQEDLKSAQASLQLAQITATRWKHLLETDSVSKQETDQAVSDLNARQAIVASNEANVRRLQQLQSYERVYAPFDGVITARNTDIGALIGAGDNSVPKELFHMAAIHTLRVYIPVPEVYADAARNGEKVNLTIDEYPGQTFTGTLVRNSDAIDPASRTLNVEVDVDNPTGKLMPGAYVFVHLKVPATSGSVTIPSNTLLFRAEGLRAGVVRDGKVRLTPVTIGHDYGATVEITSGLNPQDAVVIDPSDSLEDGAKVEIASAASKGPAQ
jgi:RND family efflux transporter MFP subunit